MLRGQSPGFKGRKLVKYGTERRCMCVCAIVELDSCVGESMASRSIHGKHHVVGRYLSLPGVLLAASFRYLARPHILAQRRLSRFKVSDQGLQDPTVLGMYNSTWCADGWPR